MAKIIPYDEILQTLSNKGFKSLYHNSGAFGFQRNVTPYFTGWIGPADSTIRAEAAHFTRSVKPPYAKTLTKLVLKAWQAHFPEPLWAMPRSHWAYELDFGSAKWLPGALRLAGVHEGEFPALAKGEAIEFAPTESDRFEGFLRSLLDNLSGSSDFQLVWPERRVLCTVHHHQQLWWATPDESLTKSLAAMVPLT